MFKEQGLKPGYLPLFLVPQVSFQICQCFNKAAVAGLLGCLTRQLKIQQEFVLTQKQQKKNWAFRCSRHSLQPSVPVRVQLKVEILLCFAASQEEFEAKHARNLCTCSPLLTLCQEEHGTQSVCIYFLTFGKHFKTFDNEFPHNICILITHNFN